MHVWVCAHTCMHVYERVHEGMHACVGKAREKNPSNTCQFQSVQSELQDWLYASGTLAGAPSRLQLLGAPFLLLGLWAHALIYITCTQRAQQRSGSCCQSHSLGRVWALDGTLMKLEFLSWVIPWKKGLCHPQESHNGLSIRELGKKHFKQLLPQTSACSWNERTHLRKGLGKQCCCCVEED